MKLPKVSARIEVYWDWPMTWYKGQVVEIKPGEDEDVDPPPSGIRRRQLLVAQPQAGQVVQGAKIQSPSSAAALEAVDSEAEGQKSRRKNRLRPGRHHFHGMDDRIEVYDIERDLWQKGIVIDAGTEGKGHPCVRYDDGATEWLSLNQTPWRRLPSLVQKESSQRLFSGERATFNLKYKYTSPRADSRPAPPPVKPKVHLPPFDVPTAHSPRVKPRAGMSLTLSRHHRTTKSDGSCFSVCVQCSTSSRAWCTTYWSYGRHATRCFTQSIT